MSLYKIERLNKLIREELGKIIVRELEFDGALVTVTSVDVSKNLEQATVWLTVYPSAKIQEVEVIFQKRGAWLQHLLGEKKIKIRHLPKLVFKIDPVRDKPPQGGCRHSP